MHVDAHQHFWRFDAAEYGWIDESMAALRRDFLPGDLHQEIGTTGVDGVVAVQARQSLDETRWLLELADQYSFIQGIVGWVPLTAPDVTELLGTLAHAPALKGVRHVVQDEPDERFLLRDDFNRGVDALAGFRLAYDLLIYERQLPQAIEFVDRHPQLTFVLDHLAKPRVRDNQIEPWRTNIRRLAERDNVYCKLSGLVTEADWHRWTEPQLTPFLVVALEAFGPRRLMFGSDWPVCLLAATYRSWYDLCRRFCARLSAEERARIFGGTAVEAYRLTTDH
jgi:L-fuconolactonase